MKLDFKMKKSAWLGLLIVGLFVVSGQAAQSKQGGMTIESIPDGAMLFVNGTLFGETPAVIDGLSSGQYVLELRKDGFDRTYEQVVLLEGQNRSLSINMDPIKGLLLVESSPAGADIIINGISKGFTPKLISDLPLGTYQIELKSSDLLPKTVEVTLAGRTPQNVMVKLDSNTARVTFMSRPEGADVRIDGVLVGKTPVTIEEVKAGEVEIKISKAGYRPYERKMTLEATKPYEVGSQLEALPSGLSISSEPKGVQITVDNKPVGVAPLVLEGLTEGTHEVIASKTGYATQVQTIYLKPSLSESLDFKMVKDSGELVFDTEPANVQVFVDGELITVTEPNGGSDTMSMPFTLSLKSDKEHVVQFVRDGFVSEKLTIQPQVDEVTTKHIVLKHIFVYDTKIVTTDNTVIKCRLEDRLPNGDLYYERFPGVYGSTRGADILEVNPISLDDVANRSARRLLEQNKQAIPLQ